MKPMMSLGAKAKSVSKKYNFDDFASDDEDA